MTAEKRGNAPRPAGRTPAVPASGELLGLIHEALRLPRQQLHTRLIDTYKEPLP